MTRSGPANERTANDERPGCASAHRVGTEGRDALRKAATDVAVDPRLVVGPKQPEQGMLPFTQRAPQPPRVAGPPAARLASPYLTPEQVLRIASDGARMGCHEALFTLGDN